MIRWLMRIEGMPFGSIRRCTRNAALTVSCKHNASQRRSGATRVPPIRGTLPAGGMGLAVGHYAETDRVYTLEDVADFGRLVRDTNPLHASWTIPTATTSSSSSAVPSSIPSVHPDTVLPEILEGHPLLQVSDEETKQSRVLVHGMLVASLFTSLFGTLIPGAVYTHQSLHFVQPVYVDGCIVTGRVTVRRLRSMRRGLVAVCDTTVTCHDGTIAVQGHATVWLPRATRSVESN